jgi:purine-binding chemotaxis protein CheW
MNRFDTRNFVAFMVDSVEYALHIAAVREIMNAGPIATLPRRPLGVLGVAELRNEVVPVVDVRVRMGLPAMPVTRRTKWILLDLGAYKLALQVEHVVGVFRADVGTEREAPPLLKSDELCRVLFVTVREEAMVFALDLAPFEFLAQQLGEGTRVEAAS